MYTPKPYHKYFNPSLGLFFTLGGGIGISGGGSNGDSIPNDDIDYEPDTVCPGAGAAFVDGVVAASFQRFGMGLAMRGSRAFINSRGAGLVYEHDVVHPNLTYTGFDIVKPAGASSIWGETLSLGGEKILALSDSASNLGPGTNEGRVYMYRDAAGWALEQTIDVPDGFTTGAMRFGSGTSVHGDHLLIAAPDWSNGSFKQGRVFYYTFNGTSWEYQSDFTGQGVPTDDEFFGDGIAFAGNSSTCYVSRVDDNTGLAIIRIDKYTRTGVDWAFASALEVPVSDYFTATGDAVWLDSNGDRMIVGLPQDDSTGPNDGKIIIYEGLEGSSTIIHTATGDTASGNARLGHGVAMDLGGFAFLWGEPGWDGAATNAEGRAHIQYHC